MGIMYNQIKSIDRGSPLRHKASVGDRLVSINGNKILDVLDYKFFAYDSALTVVLRRPGGEEIQNAVFHRFAADSLQRPGIGPELAGI